MSGEPLVGHPCARHGLEATHTCWRCGRGLCAQCGAGHLCPDCGKRSPATFKEWLLRLWDSWATRSLAVGAVATVLDIALGMTLLAVGFSTRWAAMIGVALGATFVFFANRYFAFREHDPKLAAPALRFAAITFLSMLVHGQFVVWLRDSFGVPYVVSKVIADLAVFTVGQLLALRFIVFPKQKQPIETRPSAG